MNLKYLLSITLLIPLLGLFYVNVFATNLSNFEVSSTNIFCAAVYLICIIDVVFIVLKHHKSKRI
jgi:hypothetical protein